mmetsp:Transcript_13257/g.49174  ORF Transcript_13257/g.49174 Transcript_13257/m.49174 type:complete len:247 (-) Transcript_13257:616-1356(-)
MIVGASFGPIDAWREAFRILSRSCCVIGNTAEGTGSAYRAHRLGGTAKKRRLIVRWSIFNLRFCRRRLPLLFLSASSPVAPSAALPTTEASSDRSVEIPRKVTRTADTGLRIPKRLSRSMWRSSMTLTTPSCSSAGLDSGLGSSVAWRTASLVMQLRMSPAVSSRSTPRYAFCSCRPLRLLRALSASIISRTNSRKRVALAVNPHPARRQARAAPTWSRRRNAPSSEKWSVKSRVSSEELTRVVRS